ncbi:DUF2919 domain-containing protein [Vibrio rumoiensis]|uniref:DUF2919 domain-containing protein n=1 Tax=Vibrio rumoiensis 1S-45 TaxID=1188252 RepID=A0A1E5E0N3_9VIBR|nr:DUF2919 domain-containing protein [Vibrio rumoiensis]OEF23989.1 hypothetical protein A1QC_02230 [Vibrio rumoiensis 1S-45]
MRYAIEEYDKNGFLKPCFWLWLGWLFLAKAWIVFIIASASRDLGARLLSIIYPVNNTLYLGLALSLPVVILVWSISLRTPERQWLNKIVALGRGYTIFVAVAQFMVTLYHLTQTRWMFNWSDALTMLGLIWLLLFLFQSQRAKDTFIAPNVT